MIFRLIRNVLVAAIILVLVSVLVLFLPSLWRRFITYPRFEKQRMEFAELRKEVPSLYGPKAFRGIMHSHSYWSHDSEGTIHDLVSASKQAGIDFIFLTDHPRGTSDTLPRGINGYYEGVLIYPGSEKEGFTVWALDSTVTDWTIDRDTVAKTVVEKNNIIFYSHTEEYHNWSNPWYQGMEIYNFHADVKDESLLPVLVNLLVNRRKYSNWAFRHVFNQQSSILALWDSLNTIRKIVGSSAADIHENQNIRARYIPGGRVEWVGPNAEVLDTSNVRFWNRWLFSGPDENGWIFRLMLDTYATGFSHVTNYVFADTLSPRSLFHHIKKGHLFVTFKFLGDADGFLFCTEGHNKEITGIMGDSVRLGETGALRAVSPFPGQFRLIHDGKEIDTSPEKCYDYTFSDPLETGAYRIEVHIRQGKRSLPWICTNPVYVY